MTTIIPASPESAEMYIGTGYPDELNASVVPDAIMLWADYPYDEPGLMAELAKLGIEAEHSPQFSPCG